VLLALLGAAGAAVAYGVAAVLQAVGARRVGEHHGGPRTLVRVVIQLPYLGGSALGLVGFALSLAALRSLPLFVVEPIVASSVAVTAVVAVPLLGARISRRERGAVAGTVLGLALLGASGQPGPAAVVGSGLRWALGAAAVFGLVAAVGALHARFTAGAAVLGALAGWEFGIVAVAARVLRDPSSLHGLLTDPATLALAVASGGGLTLLTTALQRGAVTATTAALVLVETAAPAAVGITLLGDTTRSGFTVLAVLGFALACAGTLALARFGEPNQATERI